MSAGSPLALVAELTHRCPLRCLYCSNPVDLQKRESELSTGHWTRVFKEAADLGTLQAHLTGGEPLTRSDLPELISAAKRFDLYVNLITSGFGLTDQTLDQ